MRRVRLRRGAAATLLFALSSMLVPAVAHAKTTTPDTASGAARTRAVLPGATSGAVAAARGSSLAPTQTGTLVNNPTTDATAQDTQSETSIIKAGGSNMVAAFNDSGSFIGGASKFTGWATSSNNGTTWTDRGALPTSSSGDAGDPVLAFSAKTGTVFF